MSEKRHVERLAVLHARAQEPALTGLLAIEVVAIFVLVPLAGMSIYALRSIQAPI